MILQEGIILKTNNYQENSKIAYILTPSGLVSAIIRGSCSYKSKNFAYSQELTKIQFAINKSKKNSFDILTAGDVVSTYANIKSDLSYLMEVAKILALCYRSIEYVTNNENIYKLLDFTLEGINQNFEFVDYCLIVFKLKLLYLLGVGPIFKDCPLCGSSKTKCFSLQDGSMICSNCRDNVSYRNENIYFEGDYLGLIKILYLAKLDKLTNELLKEITTNNKSSINQINNFIALYYDKFLSIKL